MSSEVEIARKLIQASDPRLSEDEVAELASLYARFGPDRRRLARIDLGNVEPATIFLPTVIDRDQEEPCDGQ